MTTYAPTACLQAELDHLDAEHGRLAADQHSDPFDLLALELRAKALRRRIDAAATPAKPCAANASTLIPRQSNLVSGG